MLRLLYTILLVLVHFSIVQAQVTSLTNAILYRNDGNLIQAKSEIDKACVSEKTIVMPKTWFYKGIIYKEISQSASTEVAVLDTNALTHSYEAFRKVLQLENPPAEFSKKTQELLNEIWVISINSGVGYYQNKKYTNAITEFDRAQAIKPADTTAYIYAFYAANEIHNNVLIDKYASKLISLNYSNETIYYIRVDHFMRNNQMDSALALSNKAVAAYFNDQALKTQQTEVLVHSNRSESAITHMIAMLNANPKDVQLLLNIGSQYSNLNDEANAELYYTKVLAIDSMNFVANYNMSVFSLQKAHIMGNAIYKNDSTQRHKNPTYFEPDYAGDPLRLELRKELGITKKYYNRAARNTRNESDKKGLEAIMTNLTMIEKHYLK
jgi:Flp pilus assembly protein TadD